MPSDLGKALIRFHNRETPGFRLVHVDGAFGGPTPSGDIITFFFNQHTAPATESVHEFDAATGKVGAEVQSNRPAGAIQRNVEVGIIMSRTTAQALHEWLGDTLNAAPKQERK